MYEIASALKVAGDSSDPRRALKWSFDYQQQPDGHFPQNSFTSGEPHWTGIQMDEQAFPIMLAWKLGMTDNITYTKHIKTAANFIVAHGPATAQDRWEESSGYSPATIAAEINGLLCAADIARINKDSASEKRFLDTADSYQSNVVKWTYTTSGPLGDGRYFERIDDDSNPNDGSLLTLTNHGGTYDEREIVDPSFLELVRQGILPAKSPYVLSSLTVVDEQLSQTINGNQYWFRYNHDGYGEHDNDTGSSFDGSGRGRLWPLLTGERGIYTVAAGEDADAFLTAMMAAANSNGMIPEQVWDNRPPTGCSPTPCTPGTPTRSMNPLNWAMAEYITLLVSDSQHTIADAISLASDRYITHSSSKKTRTSIDAVLSV
jgi:glucoamylase